MSISGGIESKTYMYCLQLATLMTQLNNTIIALLRRRHGPAVRGPDLKSEGPRFKSHLGHACKYSQVVRLLPAGIFKHVMFDLIVICFPLYVLSEMPVN